MIRLPPRAPQRAAAARATRSCAGPTASETSLAKTSPPVLAHGRSHAAEERSGPARRSLLVTGPIWLAPRAPSSLLPAAHRLEARVSESLADSLQGRCEALQGVLSARIRSQDTARLLKEARSARAGRRVLGCSAGTLAPRQASERRRPAKHSRWSCNFTGPPLRK